MRAGLRLRLVLAFGLVALVALALVSVVSVRETRTELEIVESQAPPRAARAELESIGREVLAAEDPAARTAALARLEPGERGVVVVGSKGSVLARSSSLEGHRIAVLADGSVEVSARSQGPGGDTEETQRMLPAAMVEGPSGATAGLYLIPIERRAVAAPGRGRLALRLLAVVLGVELFALCAAALAARGILRPVEALHAAAERMSAGDLGARVAVGGGRELSDLGQAFNRLAERLEAQEQLRRRLVVDLAHELRTPLTALRCQLEAIEDGLVEPDPAALASLLSDASVLERLVGDLQELATAESDALGLERRPVDVAAAARSALATGIGKEGPAVRIAVPEGLRVDADPDRLVQVLANLVRNARSATAAEGSIEIGAAAEGSEVALWVADTGCGISAEHLPHVFERFYRADASRDRATGGSGIGLAIVKRLVEAHGGTVEVQSTPGRGSRFTLRLAAIQDRRHSS